MKNYTRMKAYSICVLLVTAMSGCSASSWESYLYKKSSEMTQRKYEERREAILSTGVFPTREILEGSWMLIDCKSDDSQTLESFQKQKGHVTWQFRRDGTLITSGPSDMGKIETECRPYKLDGNKIVIGVDKGKSFEQWLMFKGSDLVVVDVDVCQFTFKRTSAPNRVAGSN